MNNTPTATTLADMADDRIEACLDVCEDVDTETLQRLGEGSFLLLRGRLARYQELAQRLLAALDRIQARRDDAPAQIDLALLAALRVEAAVLLHQETQPDDRHANH